MPTISPADVRTTAEMARLHLSDEALAQMTADLGRILDYVAVLQGVDVTDVPPTTHAVPLSCPLREDRVGPHDDAEAALRNAPARDGSLFAVPAIFGSGGSGGGGDAEAGE